MIATALIEFLAEYDNAITLMVRAHGKWHPVDAVTIASGPDGGLVARLDAADAVAPTAGAVWPEGAQSGARVVVHGDRTVMYRPDGSISYDSASPSLRGGESQ